MNVNHVLRIRDGNAVDTLRIFLSEWWLRVELDAMLAPVELPDHEGVSMEVIEHPNDVKKINPFLPLMSANAAPLVDGFIKDHPNGHLAVILRPCELRALVELQKRKRVQHPPQVKGGDNHKNLVIIGVDCAGTLSSAEYARQIEGHSDNIEIVRMALAYGSPENNIPYPIRTACQMCDSPSPLGADEVIGSIGAARQGYLLAIASDEETDSRLKLAELTDGLATESEAALREETAGKLAEIRFKLKSDLIGKQTWQAEDLNSVMAMFARCTLCADCLDACPLYDGELTGLLGVREAAHQRTHPLLTELVSVSRWLASCSGCGMCQEACEHGVSLMPIIITLSHRIQHELLYKPGDPNQRLPWKT